MIKIINYLRFKLINKYYKIKLNLSRTGLCLDVEAQLPRPCDQATNKAFPFCDTSLTFSARAQDLVSRIPNQEKWGLFGNGATGIPSLSISPYQWWSEALHGVAGLQIIYLF